MKATLIPQYKKIVMVDNKFHSPYHNTIQNVKGSTMARKRSVKRENGCGSVYKRSDVHDRPQVAVAPVRYETDLRKIGIIFEGSTR